MSAPHFVPKQFNQGSPMHTAQLQVTRVQMKASTGSPEERKVEPGEDMGELEEVWASKPHLLTSQGYWQAAWAEGAERTQEGA